MRDTILLVDTDTNIPINAESLEIAIESQNYYDINRLYWFNFANSLYCRLDAT